jgi:hypothetical protein
VSDAGGGNSETIPTDDKLLSNEVHGSQEESVDNVILSYKPGQEVDILFDITSFKGSDGHSVHPFGEYFGTSFDVYIDAPMLQIDDKRVPSHWLAKNNPELKADKLRKHPTIPGRYIYTVERERAEERAYGYAEAFNKDDAKEQYDIFGRLETINAIDQTGERKLLPFEKTSITAGGDIVISTDKDKVVFWDKTFNVETEHIKGEIYYEDSNGVQHPVPHNAFVAFVRLRTGARIGVATIKEDGKFELNLREEYTYNWKDDPIDFYYTVQDAKGNNITYNLNYEMDGEPRKVDLDMMYQWAINDQPIVLTLQADTAQE